MPHMCSLSITFVYTLSISVLVVSHILVGSVIFGAKLEDNTFSYKNEQYSLFEFIFRRSML